MHARSLTQMARSLFASFSASILLTPQLHAKGVTLHDFTDSPSSEKGRSKRRLFSDYLGDPEEDIRLATLKPFEARVYRLI